MERNQFKKRGGMHELNFLDSVENVISNYTVPGVIYHAFKDDGVKWNLSSEAIGSLMVLKQSVATFIVVQGQFIKSAQRQSHL